MDKERLIEWKLRIQTEKAELDRVASERMAFLNGEEAAVDKMLAELEGNGGEDEVDDEPINES